MLRIEEVASGETNLCSPWLSSAYQATVDFEIKPDQGQLPQMHPINDPKKVEYFSTSSTEDQFR